MNEAGRSPSRGKALSWTAEGDRFLDQDLSRYGFDFDTDCANSSLSPVASAT